MKLRGRSHGRIPARREKRREMAQTSPKTELSGDSVAGVRLGARIHAEPCPRRAKRAPALRVAALSVGSLRKRSGGQRSDGHCRHINDQQDHSDHDHVVPAAASAPDHASIPPGGHAADTGPVREFYACNFQDGKGMDDLMAIRDVIAKEVENSNDADLSNQVSFLWLCSNLYSQNIKLKG